MSQKLLLDLCWHASVALCCHNALIVQYLCLKSIPFMRDFSFIAAVCDLLNKTQTKMGHQIFHNCWKEGKKEKCFI